jgi:hypothetical protein
MPDLIKKKIYINNHINELKLPDRIEIAQMLEYAGINLVEKGNGVQVKADEVPDRTLDQVYNFIYNKIEKSNTL